MEYLDERLPERFWSKTVFRPDTGCWLWTAASNGRGYGQFKRSGVLVLAHRLAYESCNGPIPADLEIDHRVCRQRCCVNPTHLEAVTSAVNARRAVAVRVVKTHCKNGHEFTPENTYCNPRNKRQCIACRRLIDRRRDQLNERSYQARRKGR